MTTTAVDQTAGVRPEGGGDLGRAWRAEAAHVLRVASATLLAGAVGGLLVAGVGGRIAMRVVALQTADGYQGLRTDDGAVTGKITLLGTLGLMAFLTLVGALGGLAYAVARHALPERRRPWLWGVVTGLGVSSLVVHSDGVDYQVLGSRWVSVAMFAAISAGYGAVTAHLAERSLRPGGRAWSAGRIGIGLPFVLLVPGGTFVPVGLVLTGVVVARTTGLLDRLARLPLAVVGRVVLGALALVWVVDLGRTAAELA